MRILIEKSNYSKGIFLIGFALLLLISCKKDHYDDDPDTDDSQPIEVYIHMAVSKYIDGNDQPFYYKNGDMQQLPANKDVEVIPQDIFVSGQDVYIVGYEGEEYALNYHPKKAILWKNGVPQELATHPAKPPKQKLFSYPETMFM